MKALLFPGQGSQIVGMGSEFYKNFDIVKNIFSEADEKLKYKISDIILEGPENELKLTQNTQPAILTVSYSIFSVVKKEANFNFKDFKFFAGHSLGEYSALVSAGALKFTDAIYLLHERGKAMQEAVPVGEGGMLAVLNLKFDEVKEYISKINSKGICEIANDNADGQIIVSGNINLIKELQNILKDEKKKSILLPVSAPFHCSLMKSASEKMKEKISSIKFDNSNIEIVTNVNASAEKMGERFKNLLIEQIYSKVRWRESILNMSKQGIKEFIEIGPGKVLSGLIKRIIKECKTNSINSIDDIKNTFK
tara:strand:+ start:267 stop:1193 length:927 start_codon:yes stop_codon:yes gene_type:complete